MLPWVCSYVSYFYVFVKKYSNYTNRAKLTKHQVVFKGILGMIVVMRRHFEVGLRRNYPTSLPKLSRPTRNCTSLSAAKKNSYICIYIYIYTQINMKKWRFFLVVGLLTFELTIFDPKIRLSINFPPRGLILRSQFWNLD